MDQVNYFSFFYGNELFMTINYTMFSDLIKITQNEW